MFPMRKQGMGQSLVLSIPVCLAELFVMFLWLGASAFAAQAAAPSLQSPNPLLPDPPIKQVGERLFKETRFAEFFASHMRQDNVNLPATARDPRMDVVKVQRVPGGQVPNPYRGQSMNCRTCHFVEELSQTVSPVGSRSYADFSPRSHVPARADGQRTTVRNSSNLVESLVAPPELRFLHRDGEFTSAATLVISTLTGRNFGWLPGESSRAIAHIARVIREDDGRAPLARRYGGASYAKLLSAAPEIPEYFRLSPEFRIDVAKATDKQIVHAIARIMAGYLETLTFSQDRDGRYNGSPYDLFLAKNGLPAQPAPGETALQYSQRLLQQLESLNSPNWVTPRDGFLKFFLNQQFVFNRGELEGLKIFLRLSPQLRGAEKNQDLPVPSHTGNCARCHTPPRFTDFKFHNTGAAQDEYDAVHGAGAFARMTIPSYGERKRNPNAFLPATSHHPNASGILRSIPDLSDPRKVDLGMWNVYANRDFPEPQRLLRALMCPSGSSCNPKRILPLTIARFKTPTLRDLGQSDPYLHSGQMQTIEDVLVFYQRVSALARAGKLRNDDPEMAGVSIDDLDAFYLASFLRSLNEDYD